MSDLTYDFAAPTETDQVVQERILCFGAAGSGKTTAWLDTALWLQENGDPATFWVIDTDRSVGRMMQGEKYRGLKNIQAAECPDWTSLDKLSRVAMERAKPGDWIVVDLIDRAWEYVQNHFVQAVHGHEMDEHLLAMREAMSRDRKNLKPFEGMTDWPVINSLYKSWSARTVLNTQSVHVFACAAMKTIDEKLTAAELKEVFGHLGVYPAGQKHLAHQFQTVLYMHQMGNEKSADVTWALTTAKDRERKRLWNAKLASFGNQYMAKIAGYEPRNSAAAAATPAPAATMPRAASPAASKAPATPKETNPPPPVKNDATAVESAPQEAVAVDADTVAVAPETAVEPPAETEPVANTVAALKDSDPDPAYPVMSVKRVKALRKGFIDLGWYPAQVEEMLGAVKTREDGKALVDRVVAGEKPPVEDDVQPPNPFDADEPTAGTVHDLGAEPPGDDAYADAQYNADGTPANAAAEAHSAEMDQHASGMATCQVLLDAFNAGDKDAIEERFQALVQATTGIDGSKAIIRFLQAPPPIGVGLTSSSERAKARDKCGFVGRDMATLEPVERLYLAMSAATDYEQAQDAE